MDVLHDIVLEANKILSSDLGTFAAWASDSSHPLRLPFQYLYCD